MGDRDQTENRVLERGMFLNSIHVILQSRAFRPGGAEIPFFCFFLYFFLRRGASSEGRSPRILGGLGNEGSYLYIFFFGGNDDDCLFHCLGVDCKLIGERFCFMASEGKLFFRAHQNVEEICRIFRH